MNGSSSSSSSGGRETKRDDIERTGSEIEQ